MNKQRNVLRTLLTLLPALALIALVICSIYQKPHTRTLPVLMYHHFAPEATIDTIVTPDRFREQLTALQETGYTTVTLQQMLDYVDHGAPLPEKPVLITMDDGYTSNLTVAAPILEEFGFCATVFVIGINEGETRYPRSGEPLYPARFSYAEAAPWVEKGVLDLQSHTFDMHQLADYEYSGRSGMLPMAGESGEDYTAALLADADAFQQRRRGQVDTPLLALAYPFGYYKPETDAVLQELGIAITFTVEERCAHLEIGQRDSLRLLGRFNVTDRTSGKALVQRLQRAAD